MTDLTLASVTEVWNAASVGFAVVAGFLVGYFAVGRFASDPFYASGEATPAEYGVLTAGLIAWIGLVFFGFQVIATYATGDPGWSRVVSRFCIWLLYAGAIGAGITIRLRYQATKKKAMVHDRAVEELKED